MNPRNEKYFLGEMSEAERHRLEAELAENPALQSQFEEDRETFEMLKNQMLRRKIKAALAEPEAPEKLENAAHGEKKTRWWAWFALGLVCLLLGWLVWHNFNDAPTEEPPAAPPRQESTTPIAQEPAGDTTKPPVVPEKKDEKPPPQLAQAPIEPHSLQGLRSNNSGRTPWAILVEKIWYAPLPAAPETFGEPFRPAADSLSEGNATEAFRLLRKIERQSPANDTLVFLKGYCLMQLLEGEEALRTFDRLSGKPHPWAADVEWYRGLCRLLTGEKNLALAIFRNIAAQPKHIYRDRAKNALKLISEPQK